jgi:hypothetical protein
LTTLEASPDRESICLIKTFFCHTEHRIMTQGSERITKIPAGLSSDAAGGTPAPAKAPWPFEAPPIMKFLVGAVREPPLRVDFNGKDGTVKTMS